MRLLLVLGLMLPLFPISARAADSIAPGMNLAVAVESLKKHGYEVNTLKYGLAMAPSDDETDLEFCRIDDEVTLVIAFDRSTKQITSMDIYVFPDNPRRPKADRSTFVREVFEMQLENNEVYTLKLKRKTDETKRGK